ncbi:MULTISPECIES: DUF4436 family protein [Streptomyces]|uniref:DUF4436 domain-containing protein n=1 Tax=Streptomyces spororaveus TaxID=284039 RepID=A0ABQ3T821_9ACTN|nr:DUF4436 family protein [Streptomyces spororaveus]MCM9083208.1 DUF4436 domain-containing protein [Streptomyces spororaveus]GHI76526.1 hypothetical protein Sspor_20870 [Streptomyces spororaveus]
MSNSHRPARPARRVPLLPGLVLIAIVAAVTVGAWLQFGERQALDTVYTAGRADRDRIDVSATIQRVDAAGREMTLRVLVTPRGALAEADGVSPTEDLTVQTSTATRGDLTFKAHQRIATTDVPVALTGGSITDYPFDAYGADVEFGAVLGGEKVPVRVTLSNNDVLFSAAVDASTAQGIAVLGVDLARSNSVFIFAIFMMLAMWALAVSVLIGGWYLVTRRKGLTWPALGWMAATLFALAAFRNTAPGSPPIGCLLDYIAFLWAETVIAFCLITVVITGIRAEPPASEPADTP